MKPQTDYQKAKQILKQTATNAKKAYKNDAPLIRQIINDTAYYMQMAFNLSDKKSNLLNLYACVLHP